jgi:HK97 family phage prohead protease
MERRLVEMEVETRDAESGGVTLRGYAAVFDKWSVDLGGFREKILPGAFKRTLETADVRALWNHDPAVVLGRTRNNTLRVVEDDHGLRVEIDPPRGGLFDGLVENVRRGDVTGMSFAFTVNEDAWDGKRTQRMLRDVNLHEVSLATFPAYPQTDIAVRSVTLEDYEESDGQEPDEIEREDVLRAQADQRIRQIQIKDVEA